ncbi:putative lipid II flippase FtsW [Oceanobacillus saliphilus]|uniref:putative lipid II flippase FtsW n=1 Tax=Oceanobacillus saliphilus TaxID=2925834 RepID=UPI00201D810E|nr:putative lipid II flippase FtsW [Oceanobacillus saliphilus]
MIVNKLKKMDYLLIFTIFFLTCFGIMMVYSASFPIAAIHYENPAFFLMRQSVWFIMGTVLFVAAAIIPYKIYGKLSPILVITSLVLLILVLIPGIGVERNNSQRWIQIGSFVYQPTEVVKLFMIIYFAYFYAKKQKYFNQFNKGVLPPLVILASVFLLILSQPDLGSAALILVACGLIVFCSGVKRIHLFLMGSIGILGISYFAFTTEYRLQRLTSFLHAFEDPAGHGYQLVNSYVAIGTAGIWGNGLGNSVQKLGYLPEAHTDFIMSIILEELGIIGLAVVIGSYLIIMFRGIHIAKANKDMFAKLLAIGITFQIMTQAILNLGAVSGMLPITGITLPFISYGGSSLVITMISAGILVNLSANRTP